MDNKILLARKKICDFATLLYPDKQCQEKYAMKKSMGMFAEEVMPRVNGKLDNKQASAG